MKGPLVVFSMFMTLALLIFGIEACSSGAKLTPAGGQVGLSRKSPADDCKKLDVVDDSPYGSAKLYVNMRNKAGAMGGTYIQLTEEFHDKLGDRVIGTAYQCPAAK